VCCCVVYLLSCCLKSAFIQSISPRHIDDRRVGSENEGEGGGDTERQSAMKEGSDAEKGANRDRERG
jgi:hypothetical protein